MLCIIVTFVDYTYYVVKLHYVISDLFIISLVILCYVISDNYYASVIF